MSKFPIFDSVRIVPRNDQFLDRRVGSSGEIYFDSTSNSLRLFDGSTPGGLGVALSDLSNVENADFLSKSIAAGVGGGGSGNTTVTVGETIPQNPSAGNLWFNTNTGTLFLYYDDGDSRQWVQPSSVIGTPASATNGSVFVGNIAPISPENGDLWLNTTNGAMYVYINDGDSNQWIQPSVPVPDIPSGLSTVAISGSYDDLDDLPSLFDGDYNNLTNRPGLATVATTGDYNDLVNKPVAGDSIGNLSVSASTITTSDAAITFASPVVVNNSITFNSTVAGFDLNKLSDVNLETNPPETGQALIYNGTVWVPGAGGGGGGGDGSNADTLDGFDGSYYLNYANFTGNILDTADSSSFTFVPTVTFNSDIVVENEIFGKLVGTVEGKVNDIDPSFPSFISYLRADTSFLGKTYEYVNILDNPDTTLLPLDGNGVVNVYYITNLSNNFTVDFDSVATDIVGTLSYVLIINQGSTAYMPTTIKVNGTTSSVKWSGGGGAPAGNANYVDIVNITILVQNGTVLQVFGSISPFA